MATTQDFVEYVCEQIQTVGDVRYKKMFGEYMVYLNNKPIFLVCDNTVFVKTLNCVKERLNFADKGIPYKGAKEHYILDIDDGDLTREVAIEMEQVTPIPKPKKPKNPK
ncbi:MAG: TfoX/Sxy family protein [Clostridia bacterium]